MTRRLLAPLLLLVIALSGCAVHAATATRPDPTPSPTSTCTPPAGGRCAADVAWRGSIQISADGRRHHGVIICGGTLRASETADTVTLTLHVAKLGPGMMSCARVDVGVRLASPLGQRTVVDAVSGKSLRVVGG
jgi:hypothetical protein